MTPTRESKGIRIRFTNRRRSMFWRARRSRRKSRCNPIFKEATAIWRGPRTCGPVCTMLPLTRRRQCPRDQIVKRLTALIGSIRSVCFQGSSGARVLDATDKFTKSKEVFGRYKGNSWRRVWRASNTNFSWQTSSRVTNWQTWTRIDRRRQRHRSRIKAPYSSKETILSLRPCLQRNQRSSWLSQFLSRAWRGSKTTASRWGGPSSRWSIHRRKSAFFLKTARSWTRSRLHIGAITRWKGNI